MNDERQVVLQVRRAGDPAAPTISDVTIGDLTIVFLERPRAPSPDDFVAGAAHPCIPAGDYDVDWTENIHPKHPYCYQIVTGPGTPAPDRSDILQHAADVIDQLEGCQALGLRVVAWKKDGIRPGVPHRDMTGVESSVPALGMLQDKLCRKNYRLRIVEA